MSHVTDELFYF